MACLYLWWITRLLHSHQVLHLPQPQFLLSCSFCWPAAGSCVELAVISLQDWDLGLFIRFVQYRALYRALQQLRPNRGTNQVNSYLSIGHQDSCVSWAKPCLRKVNTSTRPSSFRCVVCKGSPALPQPLLQGVPSSSPSPTHPAVMPTSAHWNTLGLVLIFLFSW